MNAFARAGIVTAGYVLAFLVASAVVAIRVASTSGPEAQASSGMYAFGDSVVFVTVFGLLALVPTGIALFWLRPYRVVWQAIAFGALVMSLTGVSAAVLFAVGRHLLGASPLALLAAASVLRMLLAPLLSVTFFMCAALAPERSSRLLFLVAAGTEAVVTLYAVAVWFLPLWLGT